MAYGNIRYEGTGSDEEVNDTDIIPISEINFDELVTYDNEMFPTPRPAFLKEWLKQPESLAVAYKQNEEAVKLTEKYSMKPMFQTARMYTKKEPKINLQKIFGVTTFELG